MASLNYYLEKRRSSSNLSRRENLPILLYFSYEGKRFQYYTGEKTDLKYWDHISQRVYDSSRGRQINDLLNYLNDEVWALYRKAKASGIKPGNDYFRNALRKSSRRSSYDFFDIFMRFIDEKHVSWSISTFRRVKTVYNHLRAFSETCGYMVSFEKINNVFLEAFIEYFSVRLGQSNNTCHKNLMILKSFLKWAGKKGFNHNSQFLAFSFPWMYGQKYGDSALVLNREELLQFMHHNLEEKNLQQARDIFCFMCFTGLRYEEVNILKKRSVTEEWIHPGIAGKRLQRSIPLNSYSGEILRKYSAEEWPEDRCFPAFSNVTMNRLLKKAAQKAGIDNSVEVIVYSGDTERRRKIPKWQVISTRLALGTFIMTAFEYGIGMDMVREFTGHRSLAGIRKYESVFLDMKKNEMSRLDGLTDHSPLERGR
jgi:integrase